MIGLNSTSPSSGAVPVAVDPSTGAVLVELSGSSGSVQYTDGGTPPAHPIGNAIEWNNNGTWETVSAAEPLPVAATFSGTLSTSPTFAQNPGAGTPTPAYGLIDSSFRPQVSIATALPAGTNAIGSITNTAFTANAGTNLNTSALATSANQTNKSQITQIADGSGNIIASTSNALNVSANITGGSIANTSFIVTQATGTNLHAVLDTGSTTAVTQGTAANLNATVVGTGTFAVQATLSAETTKVIGTVNQGTSPWVTSITPPIAGTIYSGQKAVTGSAAAISTTQAITQGVTVEALSTNTISVFVGPSGVSDATGIELPPGASITLPVNNIDLVYVIASTTGATVSYVAV